MSVVVLGVVVGVEVVTFQRLFFAVQCLVSVVQFRTCQSGLVCLVCVRLCQVSLICVHLVAVVVFVDVGLPVDLLSVGGHFAVVVVVGRVCAVVGGVLFVSRPSPFCGSVAEGSAHFVNDREMAAAGSFLYSEHKINHSYRISEACPYFRGEVGHG